MKKIVLSLLAATTALTMPTAASAATNFTNNWSFVDTNSNTVVKGTLSGLSDGDNISASGLSATVTQAPFGGFGVFNVFNMGSYSATNGVVTYADFFLRDATFNNLFFGTNPGFGTYYPQLYVYAGGRNAFNLTVGDSFSAATGAVPEPASWAMMIGGVGLMGFAMRRKSKVKTTVKFA